jgi:hypothetical protein
MLGIRATAAMDPDDAPALWFGNCQRFWTLRFHRQIAFEEQKLYASSSNVA